jgi:hypothetical protein
MHGLQNRICLSHSPPTVNRVFARTSPLKLLYSNAGRSRSPTLLFAEEDITAATPGPEPLRLRSLGTLSAKCAAGGYLKVRDWHGSETLRLVLPHGLGGRVVRCDPPSWLTYWEW